MKKSESTMKGLRMKTLNELIQELGNFKYVTKIQNNQYEIVFEKGFIFQSYQTIMAVKTWNEIYLRENWQISNTTSKYLYQFLDLDRKELLQKIKENKIQFFKD